MSKEQYLMNYTKEQLAAKLAELDKKYRRERSCDEIMAKKQISKSGAAKLREELDFLVTVRRAEMAQKLKEARAQGDLSENAEYDEANRQDQLDFCQDCRLT